jgi:hypothetical protein
MPGYKVGEAYADFRMDVDKAIGDAMAKLKASGSKFDRMGRDAGEGFGKGFGRGLDLNAALDKAVEGARTRTNQIQRLGNNAGEGYSRGFSSGINLRSAMVEQVGVVKSARPAFALEGKQAGQAYARGFGNNRLSGPSVSSGAGGAEASGEETARAMARGFRKGSGDMDSATQRVAQRTEARFSALKFLGLSQGLPAAAAAGVLATTGIVAAAGALFIGLGIAGARGSEQVRDSWIGTANVVTHGITAMSTAYEGPLVKASETVAREFMRSSGLIQRGMDNAAGGVGQLVDGAISLAENALPGVVVASGRLGPVLDGVHSLLGNVGTGFGEMAANASTGNEGARKGLVILGDTLRTTEARVGTIAANFANASSGPLNSFRYTLDQVTGALVDASSKGSAVNGFLSGFSTSTNGAITVARGFFSALNALPPQVAQIGGAVASTSMIMSKLGVDAGAGWEGLGGKIRGAGKELAGAEKFAAKAGTAIGGMAAGALNPAALAVGALSIGLLLLGDRQEKAAAAAAEHRESVRQLTDSIRQDNGALGEHSATVIANALASKDASRNLGIANITMAEATVAAQGNEKALRRVTNASSEWIQNLADSGTLSQRDVDGLKGINAQLLSNGGSYESVASNVAHFNESMAATNKPAMDQLVALLNGTGALGEQAKAAREAYQGYQLQEQGLTGLTEAQIKARDATIENTKAIYEQQNANLGYRGAVLNSKDALDTYNKAAKDHKLGTDEGAKALLQLEQAFGQQEQAAYNAAYANSTAATEQGKLNEATRALNRETVNIANSFSGTLPASLSQTISKMSLTEAQAAGLKVNVNNLGQAVYTLPNGKQITISAETGQAVAAIDQVRGLIRDTNGKVVTLRVNTQYGYSNIGVGTGGRGSLNAKGNLYNPNIGMASGGFPVATSGNALRNVAQVVPPGTLKWIGDAPTAEVFAPLNGSQRTKDLLAIAAQHEGLQVRKYANTASSSPAITMRAPTTQTPAAAPHTTINNYITAPPAMDLEVLAAAVSRQIMLRGK